MPCSSCWPFRKKHEVTVTLDGAGRSNGEAMYKKTHTYVNNTGDQSRNDEIVLDLTAKNETLKRIANQATTDLKAVEKLRRELEEKLKERDSEIERLKEILKSISDNTNNDNKQQTGMKKKKKEAVLGSRVDENIEIRKHDKSPEQRRFLREAILKNDFLRNVNAEQIEEMIDCMETSFPQNRVFIKEGTNGDRFYILEAGELEVTQGNTYLTTMKAGSVFGELAILYNCKRTATVTAKTPTKIWMLERSVYQAIMMRTTNNKRHEINDVLRKVPLLKSISRSKLGKLVDALDEEAYSKGHYIVRQGEEGETFYIIIEGEVDVTVLSKEYSESTTDASPQEKFIRTLGRGDYFGEGALRNESGKRGANVIAKTNTVRCMTLDKKPFLQHIGNLADKDYDSSVKRSSTHQSSLRPSSAIAYEPRTSAATSIYPVVRKSQIKIPTKEPSGRHIRSSSTALLDMPRRKVQSTFENVTLKDFEFVGVLGVGGFGRVELVKLRGNADTSYALKCMKKTHIVETKQEEHIFSEKKIMRDSDSPFIVRLFRTYKNDRYVYMLMEACLGGELWAKLRDDGYFEDNRARFYTACVVEAIEYLHLRGIVYRDLKPENLLLDEKGYVKIVDFGFAKSISHGEKTWTFCGTPEYVAPEVIINKGHDIAVDYWALGILIFEMLTGNPPFNSADAMKTYRMALKGIDAIEWPSRISKSAQNLIRRLCRENPSERIGNMREGVKDIRSHKWFNGFHWAALRTRELPAPYVPEIANHTDIRNFDRFEREDELVEKELSGWDEDY